jgi:hypothetical protein
MKNEKGVTKSCACGQRAKGLKEIKKYFHNDIVKPDGFASCCKECQKMYTREYYQEKKDYCSIRMSLIRQYQKKQITRNYLISNLKSLASDYGVTPRIKY